MEGYFPIDYRYGQKDGWRIAFNLVAYDSSSDQTPFADDFGTVDAYLKIWGEKDEQGNYVPTYFKKLKTEPCKADEINLTDPDEKDVNKHPFFYPADEFINDTKRFAGGLRCIREDYELMGEYNDAAARQLVIKFDICRDKPGTFPAFCRPENEIKEWMNRKFLLILEN